MSNMHNHCFSCNQEFNLSTGAGVVYKDYDGNPVDLSDRSFEASMRRAQFGSEPYCEKGHRLPKHNALLIGLFGEFLAGKDRLLHAIRTESNEKRQLGQLGLDVAPDPSEIERWQDEILEWRATEPATEESPRVPFAFEVRSDHQVGSDSPAQPVLIFNSSGEEFRTTKRLRSGARYAPYLDAIIIAVPPPCLTKLPKQAREGNEATLRQSLDGTRQGILLLEKFINDPSLPDSVRNKKPTIVLALTKCDRYSDIPEIEEHFLKPRKPGRVVADLIEEQALLARFMIEYGGQGILDAAARVGHPVFLCAVSGTGADTADDVVSADADPTRSIDPLLITLMREGILKGQHA